jgi:hypothetical protein
MQNIEFDTDTGGSFERGLKMVKILGAEQRGLIGWLVRRKISKNAQSARMLLLILVIVNFCVIGALVFRFSFFAQTVVPAAPVKHPPVKTHGLLRAA